ncbi:hypothetical protein [uncultured Flavobacterium sp.]|uniref:hypothetical protein n=1 Tax=uncultured Flavobacterium sp. TaxID=165435 RepID=UPI0030C86CFB
MALSENSGSIITEEKARILINAFDRKYPGEVVSSFIGTENVNHILNQENCIGLRIYNGYDDENSKMSLVLVGVDTDEKDMLEQGIIYDEMITCPPTCPLEGSLSEN